MKRPKKQVYEWRQIEPWPKVSTKEWRDWRWQMSHALKSEEDFLQFFELSDEEKKGFEGTGKIFRTQSTPYYASLADKVDHDCSIRQMLLPNVAELFDGYQQMLDPLGENIKKNRPCERLVHRYTDRALFLATDMCGMYCRYCTRKHFTASDQVMASQHQLDEAVKYVKQHPEIKEVIFSGGDPLTLSNSRLEKMLSAFYEIETLEIIRMGSRMPVVNPFRVDEDLIKLFQSYQPLFFMTHFNHPDELTEDAVKSLTLLVDNGIPVFNQMVLLNGINNHPDLVYALSRRLLYLRVKPHYMFQADPSLGTDHLRNSIEDSLQIQRQLWGHTSGLAMPQYIVDIPEGGGKVALTPNFVSHESETQWSFKGWDGVEADYLSPKSIRKPFVAEKYKTRK